MFANATLYSLYAEARRADDLRPHRVQPVRGPRRWPVFNLRALLRSRAAAPEPALQPR